MKKLALVMAFLIACCPAKPAVKAPETPQAQIWTSKNVLVAFGQLALIESVRRDYPMVKSSVVWTECKQLNSFYYPRSYSDGPKDTIQLCTDMVKYPEVALYYAAHEMGHAVSDVYTYTWNEIDADELAVLFMVKLKLNQGLIKGAEWWKMAKNQDWADGDTHPGNRFRSWYLSCLEAGSRGEGAECTSAYKVTKLKWDKRLSDARQIP